MSAAWQVQAASPKPQAGWPLQAGDKSVRGAFASAVLHLFLPLPAEASPSRFPENSKSQPP